MSDAQSGQMMLTFLGLDRDAAYTAAGALSELVEPPADAVTVFEDGDQYRADAYYSDEALASQALSNLRSLSDAHATICEAACLEKVADKNWVALSQAALPPVLAGRYTICGSHDLHRVARGRNTIIVEAGEAFGTAHHATTYGCLLAIDRVARRRAFNNVLDLGCGSGILALAVARTLPSATVTASDIDERSVEVAIENAQRNGMNMHTGSLTFHCADGTKDVRLQRHAPYDLIIANILAGPLIAMAPDITTALARNGTLLLSGILVPQAREVTARYSSLGLNVERHDRHNGWSTLELRRNTQRPSASRASRSNAGSGSTLYMPADD